MGSRAKILGAATGLMVGMGVASTAWACQSAVGAFVADPLPSRSPVGAPVAVKGGGWVPVSQVQVGWQMVAAGEVQPLTTAATDQAGAFSVSALVPEAPAGVNYLSVTQGSTTRLMPFEVEAAGASPVAASPAAGKVPQGTNGADADATGLGDIPASSSTSSSSLLFGGAAAAGAVALGGLATAEVRRRRVRVRVGR